MVHKVEPRAADALGARLRLGLSQREFAAFIGTGVGTVRKWKLGTRKLSGPARTLIEVIKTQPTARDGEAPSGGVTFSARSASSNRT